MKTYHHVVVGVDFSPASGAALRTALRLAAIDATPVTVLHVVDPNLASAIKEAHHFSDDDVMKHINDRVQAFIQESQDGAEVPLVNMAIEFGHPYRAIYSTCEKHLADLLVLGTRGTEHGPNHIGAVAAKCARKIPADVLLVREELTGAYQHITVCVDFSDTAAHAVRSALFIAEHDKARLDALYVHQSTLAMSLDYGGFLPPMPDIEISTQASLKEELDHFLKPLVESSAVPAFRSIVLDRVNIREAIVDHIKAEKSDLVVLGTRGKTDLRTLLIGTTAERIVNHAPCSVLAVKPEVMAYATETQEEDARPLVPLIPVA